MPTPAASKVTHVRVGGNSGLGKPLILAPTKDGYSSSSGSESEDEVIETVSAPPSAVGSLPASPPSLSAFDPVIPQVPPTIGASDAGVLASSSDADAGLNGLSYHALKRAHWEDDAAELSARLAKMGRLSPLFPESDPESADSP